MCPLRFILIFFSATLAGYFAWKSLRSGPEEEGKISASGKEAGSSVDCGNREFSLRKALGDGFRVFVDMASGRYLWRNLSAMKEEKKKVESETF